MLAVLALALLASGVRLGSRKASQSKVTTWHAGLRNVQVPHRTEYESTANNRLNRLPPLLCVTVRQACHVTDEWQEEAVHSNASHVRSGRSVCGDVSDASGLQAQMTQFDGYSRYLDAYWTSKGSQVRMDERFSGVVDELDSLGVWRNRSFWYNVCRHHQMTHCIAESAGPPGRQG